jgi:exosortase D (VPLPA-CTERM-specific)
MLSAESIEHAEPPTIWQVPLSMWAAMGVLTAGFTCALYEHGLNRMLDNWLTRDEYSHAIIIPLISLFFIWQKKDVLERMPFTGSWAGVGVMFAGVILIVLGELSATSVLIQYGFYIVIAGMVLAYTGRAAFRKIWVPLLLLVFTIPLPGLIYQDISQRLQLVSTKIGVWVIKLFGISVHAAGNVIDLGTFQLQVVDACSGLRYLFPLMTFGFIVAYMFKVEMWKRVVIFLSTIPITIFMNSFRIGAIGVTVEFWGPEMAEGFLHDFEGWAVFMACTGILLLEMWILAAIGRSRRPLLEVFGLEFPANTPSEASLRQRSSPAAFVVSALVVVVVSIAAVAAPQRKDVQLARKEFSEFPIDVGNWQGRAERIDRSFVERLDFDDYLFANYAGADEEPVNLYVAWYGSQSKGASIHSPAACLPGGGWQIQRFATHEVPGAVVAGQPLVVNRVEIQKGDDRQLVYYWFQQRGRIITDEYLLKWYVFWDAITRNRTDGALVRLTGLVRPGENWSMVDERLTRFARVVADDLDDYVPP